MQHGYFQFAVRRVLVEAHDCPWQPAQPKGAHEDEAHPVARVREVFGKRGRILFVVDGRATVQLALHREDIEVVVRDGHDAGAEDEDSKSGRVRVRGAPI